MKRKILIAALMIITAGWVRAQEFKVAKSTGRLELHIGRVSVEGHNGSEIIFSSADGAKRKDERADGLRPINGMGIDDNTGLDINVTEKDGIVTVRQLKKTESPRIKILVPKAMIVSYSFESQYGGEVRFKNMENEIEVSAQYNSIELENVTGPLTIKTIYGHVESVFGATVKGPISIVSVYGYVDVTIPQDTKANLKLSTSYGQIFAAPEFKIEVNRKGELQEFSDEVEGKINGGGTSIDLDCNYGKVYLRKK